MFEKDIYQLIRGLRANKGREREYIQEALRECRKEIRGPDMDQKATALLKLVYLEMFGHDMSWASFNVLEVMSSQKYLQKRVGYLAAVQSFRSDTEVLMLAENLLKKDLSSPDKATIALPLITIPHVISASMANSLLTDLLPRLSHSNPAIRKKTIVTLYRLALVYPETLRPAWPKIKERLQDESEDPSVTAAIVNVICELGWRRPQDFLPLAPRLFELLTSSSNNWMAIKIIKLFSTLLPLEPRLVKKLLPPMTSIIKTTPAMSLLYECVNGIIQGGILEAVESTTEGDEIARLCINKLRAMLVVEGDPNLRYVALLAFARIPSSYSDLVSEHQDVVLECIDDPDISIRIRALDLVIGMVDSISLQAVVERLLKQLRTAGRPTATDNVNNDRGAHDGITPRADDDDDEQSRMMINPKESRSGQAPPLPDDYRTSVIERILEMCSKNTYANMTDFEWYVGVLVELVKQCPAASSEGLKKDESVADAIGRELLNVAVRVKAVRSEAAAASQSLLLLDTRDDLFPAAGSGGYGVLASAAFVAGEFAGMLPNAEAVLNSLTHPSSAQLPTEVLLSHVQAIPKIFSRLASSQQSSWTQARASHVTLIIARIVHFLEPLALHPNLEIQERAVEFLDLMRLTSEAVSNHKIDEGNGSYAPAPLLLTQAIPSLFDGTELNPVAPTALKMVPQPDELDLETPINGSLNMILQQADYESDYMDTDEEVYKFYHEKPSAVSIDHYNQRPAAELLEPSSQPSRSSSYQDVDADMDERSTEKKKAERQERYRDDPYYIGGSERSSNSSTPLHNILRSANGEPLDVDSIPVMELKFDAREGVTDPRRTVSDQSATRKPQRHFEIAGDETLGGLETSSPPGASTAARQAASRGKRTLLEVDSSALSSLALDDDGNANGHSQLDFERRQAEEEEMAKAMKEVERLRLEMQRAQEQIPDAGEEMDVGTVVVAKKKKKKARLAPIDGSSTDAATAAGVNGEEGGVVAKKKKKKKKREQDEGEVAETLQPAGEEVNEPAPAPAMKTKKKKRRQIVFDEDGE